MANTSNNNGHKHTWSRSKRFTSTIDKHRHGIDLVKMVAITADGHTHKLLNDKTKQELRATAAYDTNVLYRNK